MPAFVPSTTIFHLGIQPTLDLPTTATTNTTCTPPSAVLLERSPFDDFSGSSLSTYIHESRRDSAADVLPPYVEDTPPMYSPTAPEPVTMAEHFFKYGFLFPPFWIFGAWFLWLPLRAPNRHSGVEIPWMADKTELELQCIIGEMRRAEVRWALRCIWALVILILLGMSSGIATWAVLHL
ncbi:hypothetical protein C0992_006855 [Termitomyces sp. T32_za158]|nr:hypothetical protein C0992_006855 [Termitomyces sp. T32_za158]